MNILLCDDDNTLFVPFVELAQPLGVKLICTETWADAQNELELNWNKYHGIILDYKGKRNSDSKSQDVSHLTLAIGWLREQKARRKYLPVVLYTGFKEEASERYPVDDMIKNIFDKNRTSFGIVIKEFLLEIERNHIVKLHIKFPEPFAFADTYFSENNQKYFFELFKDENYFNPNEEKRIKNLTTLRRLHEHMWDIMCEQYIFKDLDDFSEEPGKRTKKIRELVNGEAKLIPSVIYNWSNNLFFLASNYGDHNPIDDPNLENLPSNYVITHLCFGLLEAMVWCNQLINSK